MRTMEKETGEHLNFKVTKTNIHKGGVILIVFAYLRRTNVFSNPYIFDQVLKY